MAVVSIQIARLIHVALRVVHTRRLAQERQALVAERRAVQVVHALDAGFVVAGGGEPATGAGVGVVDAGDALVV
jgi:hypothetical protein